MDAINDSLRMIHSSLEAIHNQLVKVQPCNDDVEDYVNTKQHFEDFNIVFDILVEGIHHAHVQYLKRPPPLQMPLS